MIDVNIYRYNPETDKFPYTQTYTLQKPEKDIMLLELLNILKELEFINQVFEENSGY